METYKSWPIKSLNKILTLLSILFIAVSCSSTDTKRSIISLNGEWEVAETIDTVFPQSYSSRAVVPGLLDMAHPPFDSIGRECTQRKYFWYRKNFDINSEKTDFVYLKIHKAKFGHAVYVNGKFAGKYDYCFTPSFFEISKFLNYGSSNEIVIRTGASSKALPDSIPSGFDQEKSIYLPGIYDNVELIEGNFPYIENIQIVPQIEDEKLEAVVYLEYDNLEKDSFLDYTVREKLSGKIVAEGYSRPIKLNNELRDTVVLEINIPSCRLWSPEDPFLYELLVNSEGDSKIVPFGMREFKFDSESKLAMLNGRPYYLRGTNIAMHRFFEDSLRQNLPWKKDWIHKVYGEFKDMHWNAFRFHVGFAPDDWYDIADEMGFLIQDEYAIWGSWSESEKKRHRAPVLAREYEAWMKERWNHPSVVIWDAQNETVLDQTGLAIGMVRDLDLSDRPWDNGYSAPEDDKDVIESHPYMFVKENQNTFAIQPPWRFDSSKVRPNLPEGGWLKNELSITPELFNDANDKYPSPDGKDYPNAYLINEYGWIWLYRNGDPAWAAEEVWRYYPEYDNPEKRFEWRGRVIAAQTEYWRSRRNISGVLHFCAITCDRSEGVKSQVSDDLLNVEDFILQPGFKKYVKPAFSPVGIMIKKWDDTYKRGEELQIPVVLFNDLYDDWNGEVLFKIEEIGGEVIEKGKQKVEIKSLGLSEIVFNIQIPEEGGDYEMTAEFNRNGERIFSSRLFSVKR